MANLSPSLTTEGIPMETRLQSISNRVVASESGELPQEAARDPRAHDAWQAPIGARKGISGR